MVLMIAFKVCEEVGVAWCDVVLMCGHLYLLFPLTSPLSPLPLSIIMSNRLLHAFQVHNTSNGIDMRYSISEVFVEGIEGS